MAASQSETGAPYLSDGSAGPRADRASSIGASSTQQPPSEAPLNRRFSLSGAGNISLDDVEAVHVSIRGLAVAIDTAPSWLDPSTYLDLMGSRFDTTPRIKTLLHSVAADLAPGTLTAIIGGSGSGKTTFLNTMAERLTSSRLSRDGSITFNRTEGVQVVRHAYVMQQDILLPTLTVRETLRYSADLRLPQSTSSEDRSRVVDEVIRELGLKECADTRIGNSQHRGCSGGEKRRVSIGVQLLANPSVLFLDEPTTGLDATSAFQLIRTLKKLAQKGRTIITTVHQPRSEIWDLFDNLVVLSKGSPVYSGEISGCLPWFEELGFHIPPFVNPAEFVIDIAAVDNRSSDREEQTMARVQRLKDAWIEESNLRYGPFEVTAEKGKKMSHSNEERAGFIRQLAVLTHRTLKVTYRDPLGMGASIFEAIIMSIISGYLFYDLGRDQAGIRSREGALYTAAGLQGYLILIFEVYRMTIDMPTFDRESCENCVDALPFILSRRLARLPTEDLPVPFLFSVIFYFMAGFDRNASKFFIFFAVTLTNHYIAVTCALTCVVAVRHFAGASLIANLVYTLQSMACGMFIQSETIPVYVRWLKWITYTFFVFGAYAGNEFQGSFYDCPVPGGVPSDPNCRQYTGSFVMDSLGFPPDWVWRPIVIMVAFVVFFVLLSFVGLKYLKVEMTIARPRVSNTDLSAGKEKMATQSVPEVRAIDIGLQDFALGLDKRTIRGKRLLRKTILSPLNATFQAGVLNVIMGPSGSGKTSLLNAMALRLRNSVGTRYRPSGQLTFNGAVPSDTVIRSVCSYVCQDDDALLPSLTVRETLMFAAGLRLPSFMSKEEKRHRAEDVLLKMGLKDCADNVIGNEMIKGISGGEKRRVSIAIQVLTDPRILLLDEPTSGLDAFTASSIMEVLQGLANEGRTLILTIHQARSDLFNHFGNVLLLARGGSTVYSGYAQSMLGYFSRQGYDCPQHTNPADFALDMITIDLQQDQREAESRDRVKGLIDHWKSHGDDRALATDQRLSKIQEADELVGDGDWDREPCYEKADMVATEQSKVRAADRLALAASRGRKSFSKASLSTPAELGALVRKRASLRTSVPLLLHRAIINTRRQPELITARLMQVVGLALVLALFFAPLDNNYFSVQNRMGFVQEIGAFYFVGMLQNVAIYPNERDVFYREDDDGVYGVEAFIWSYTMIEVPFEIVSCLIFGVLGAIAVGLPRTVTMYFVTVFACFGIVSCGESLGIMFNTVLPHTGFAVNVMGIFLSVANSMAGVLSIDMPDLFKAVNYLSPIRYATRAVAPYSLRGINFTCNDKQRLPSGRCPIETGQDVLDLYNFDVDPVVNVAALAGCLVVYRLLAWGLLKLMRGHWRERMKTGKQKSQNLP